MVGNTLVQSNSVSFGEKLAASHAFDQLFRAGMDLVEDTATYLDGAGRDEARHLSRVAALAYASESMRLTTRLMQIASWLLLQRAVNEGELSQHEAASDKRRSKTAWTGPSDREGADGLPPTLGALIAKSLQLQGRVQRLDSLLCDPAPADIGVAARPLETQLALLRDAFPGKDAFPD